MLTRKKHGCVFMTRKWLKPTKRKIILALIIFAFIPSILLKQIVICMAGPCPPILIVLSPLILMISLIASINNISEFLRWLQIDTIFLIAPIISAVLSYIVACALLGLWEKSYKTKEKIIEKLKPSKGRLIIFLAGCIPVFFSFINWLSRLAGGTINSPPIIQAIIYWQTPVLFLLFPFTVITFLALLPATTILTSLLTAVLTGPFMEIFRISNTFTAGDLTLFGGLIIIPLLAIEWYIIACFIIGTYEKIRARKKCT